jgi:hypothetical protein
MSKGFMYLFVIIDWHSRFIVDYELSNTIDKLFAVFVKIVVTKALKNCIDFKRSRVLVLGAIR